MTDEKQRAELIFKFKNDVTKRSRLNRTLLAFDQLLNVVLWNGSQDETISSHIARRQADGISTWFDDMICRCLNKLESNHCRRAEGE